VCTYYRVDEKSVNSVRESAFVMNDCMVPRQWLIALLGFCVEDVLFCSDVHVGLCVCVMCTVSCVCVCVCDVYRQLNQYHDARAYTAKIVLPSKTHIHTHPHTHTSIMRVHVL